MADLKALIEHIARRHWEYGQGGQWEIPEGVNPADQPFPAYASESDKNQYRAYATQLLSGSAVLSDVIRDEQLHGLLSHCWSEANIVAISDNEHHASVVNGSALAYGDVARRLSEILGEETG